MKKETAFAGFVLAAGLFLGGMTLCAKPANIVVEKRGLIEISGLLKMDTSAAWGAGNLIVKPFGGWAAQDYCLEDIEKSEAGKTITVKGIFNTTPRMKLVETVRFTGKGKCTVKYVLTPEDGKKALFERIFITFPLGAGDFVKGKVRGDKGPELTIPEVPKEETLAIGESKGLTVRGTSGQSLILKSRNLKASLQDLRPKTDAFQAVLELPMSKEKSSFELEFELSANMK